MSRACLPLKLPTVLALCVLMIALRAGAQDKAIEPPRLLLDLGLTFSLEQDHADQAWQDVVASVKPFAWPKSDEINPEAALTPEATQLLQDSGSAMSSGEAFRAVRLLREADELSPGHPMLYRALGIAYAESGNLARAARYLRPVVARDRDDVEALVLLARQAEQSRSLDDVLGYAQALEVAKAPAPLADYYRAAVLTDLGYATAAAQRWAVVLEALGEMDAQQAKEGQTHSDLVQRELDVMLASRQRLQIKRGDVLLALEENAAAAQAFSKIESQDPATRRELVARRAFLALRSGDEDTAVDEVVALMQNPRASERDAQLVGYVTRQGVPRDVLAERLEQVLQEQGVTMARLQALSLVAPKQRLLDQLNRWIASSKLPRQDLQQAVGLIDFDDDDPAEARPLVGLLDVIAGLMAEQPEQALGLAQSAVGAIDAPVTLLRAIRSDAFAADRDAMRQLISAVSYEHVLRRRDAVQAYAAALDADAGLSAQIAMPLARLQLALGQFQGMRDLLGEPTPEDDWPRFELKLRSLAGLGDIQEALAHLDRRIVDQGSELPMDTLRLEFIAQIGQPRTACKRLLDMIDQHPEEQWLYELGMDLVHRHQQQFRHSSEAERFYRDFLRGLATNLPDSTTARLSRAHTLIDIRSALSEAERLMLDALDQEPRNPEVLAMLTDIYTKKGDLAKADQMFFRFAESLGPGLSEVLAIAERDLLNGQLQDAADQVKQALELERQGVLPGPEMTESQANVVTYIMERASKEDQEALYLSMVKRFPDNALLNNALGYRWAVKGKNLRQAKAMIERALKAEPMSHSLLDSLAWVQYKLGEFEKAKTTQSRALLVLEDKIVRERGRESAGNGSSIAILNDHMGDILYRLGDTRQAVEHWRVAEDQDYTEEQMAFEPELRSLKDRLSAKIEAASEGQLVPVAEVPGPESHGPDGHPADLEPQPEGEEGENQP